MRMTAVDILIATGRQRYRHGVYYSSADYLGMPGRIVLKYQLHPRIIKQLCFHRVVISCDLPSGAASASDVLP